MMGADVLTMDTGAWTRDLDEWCTAMRGAGMSRSTIAIRRGVLRTIARRFPLGPATVTRADLEAYLARPGWSAQTRASYRQHLRAFFGWMVDCERLEVDPSARLARVRVPGRLPRPCPEADLAVALARAGDRERLALMLGSLAGLRRHEIAKVHSDDLAGDLLRVVGKGGRERLVPLPPVLVAELRARPRGWVFPSARSPDGHVAAYTVGKWCRALLPGWGAHSLRHRYATTAYAGSHDLVSVQQLLGHASVATTQVYVRVDLERLREVVAAIA